jgi:hypothetical protein
MRKAHPDDGHTQTHKETQMMLYDLEADVKRYMRHLLVTNPEPFNDCGDVSCTKLAEAAQDEFDMFSREADDAFGDWAVEVAAEQGWCRPD